MSAKNLLLTVALIFTSALSYAQTSHKGIPVEIYIAKPDGSPLSTSDFSTVSQIISSNGCVLMEEFFSNLSVKDGYATLFIGKGIRTTDDKGLPLPRVFGNPGLLSGLNPLAGEPGSCSYTSSRDEGRLLRLTLNFMSESVIAEFPLQSVPYAVVADDAHALQGFTADQLLKKNDFIGLNQLSFERMFQAFQTNTIPADSIAMATKSSKGVMQVGSGLSVNSGIVSIAAGGISDSMIATEGISLSKISGAGLLAYKSGINDLDVTGTISAFKISGLGGLATKTFITDADVNGTLSAAKISGLGPLATKIGVDDNDVVGSISYTKIAGLGTLATKSVLSDSDISISGISIGKISGAGNLAGQNLVTSPYIDNFELSANWDAKAKTLTTGSVSANTVTTTGNMGVATNGQIFGAANIATYSGTGDVTVDFDKGNTVLVPSTYGCAASTYINLTNFKIGATYSIIIQNTGTTQCNFKISGVIVTSATMKFSPSNTTRPSGYQTIYSILVASESPALMYTAWSSGFQ